MRTRILPPDEWPRLKGTEAEKVWPRFDPSNTRVLVVEDEAGEIVATWALLRVVHAECIWVAPKHRGAFKVARRLLRGLREIAAEWGAKRVLTGSVSPEVTALIEKVGGKPMPCDLFVLPVDGAIGDRLTRQFEPDRELGRLFHMQLDALVPDNHPQDDEHDVQVGRALRLAIEGGEPERAADQYNAWARGAGYEPVTFLGTVGGCLRADIASAVIEVDPQYFVRVVEEEPCQRQR